MKHKLESRLLRVISIISYVVDTTLMTESEEEVKSPLMKEESENVGLKLNIQKTKIMAYGPITSWQIDGETVETVTDFILGEGSKITADGDYSCEIKRHLLLGRKAMKNLNSLLKSRDNHFSNKVLHSQSYSFSSSHVQMWEIDHKECWALKNWCFWTMVLRVPCTARRSNQSVLKEINPEYSLEGMMLELKCLHFGHLMHRANSLEKILILGKI